MSDVQYWSESFIYYDVYYVKLVLFQLSDVSVMLFYKIWSLVSTEHVTGSAHIPCSMMLSGVFVAVLDFGLCSTIKEIV